MKPTAIALIVVLVSALISAMYLRKYGKKVDDYYLMGRNAPGWVVGAATMASWGTLFTWVGAVGFSLQFGGLIIFLIAGSAWGMLYLCVYLGRLLRRGEYRTLSSYFEERYSTRVSHIAALVLSVGTIFYLFPQFTGMGAVLLKTLGIPFFWSIVIFSIFMLVFVFMGGMASAIMFGAGMFIIMLASCILYPIGLHLVTGTPIGEMVATTAQSVGTQYWTPFGMTNAVSKFTVGYWVVTSGSWFAIAMSSGHIISLSLACKSERELVKGYGIILPLALFCIAVYYVMSPGVETLIPRGSMKTDFVAPHLYANLFPPWIGVIQIVGVVAAGLSTVGAMFVFIATNLTQSIVKLFNLDSADLSVLKVTKVVIVFLGILCIPLGYYMPAGVMVIATGFMGAFLLSCIFLPLAIGSSWGRVTEKAIMIHMSINLVICLFMVITNVSLGWFAPHPLIWLIPISIVSFIGLTLMFAPTDQDMTNWNNFYAKCHSIAGGMATLEKGPVKDSILPLVGIFVGIGSIVFFLAFLHGW